MRSAISRRTALHGLAAIGIPSLAGLADAAPAGPKEVLEKEHGLVRLPDGLWRLPLEAELKDKLASLPLLRESVVSAERDLEERVAANRRAWVEAAPTLETLKQTLGRLSPTDPKREPIARQIEALSAAACEPARLSSRGEVRDRLITFGRDRILLQLALLWIRTSVPRLHQEYARLTRQPEVVAAVQKLGERLGPQKDYSAEVKRLGEYDKLVFTSWLPVYQQAGQTRVAAVVNEQGPVTFSWSEESDGKVLLPTSALEPCGLAVDIGAALRPLKIAGRGLDAREIVLPTLRLGRHVVKNLSALLLPPEGEDLGARLPRHVLTTLRVGIEFDRLRMTITE